MSESPAVVRFEILVPTTVTRQKENPPPTPSGKRGYSSKKKGGVTAVIDR